MHNWLKGSPTSQDNLNVKHAVKLNLNPKSPFSASVLEDLKMQLRCLSPLSGQIQHIEEKLVCVIN